MGQIRPVVPVKLFVGILSSAPEIVAQVEERLIALFGSIDLRSDAYPFDSTHYYDAEMGTPIERRFVAFENLVAPAELAAAKVRTNELEADFQVRVPGRRRPVNLDPGYLEQSKIVLASTKNFYHRILISGGIYGEVTQHFEAGEWRSFPWTFPDFRSGRYNVFFLALRKTYRGQLRGRCLPRN
jgi:hypothetical protein